MKLLRGKYIRAGVIFAVLMWLGSVPRADAADKHPAGRYLSPLEAAEMLVEGKERVFLLDVRLDWEYGDYHIPGAVNIPVQKLALPANLAKLPKGRKILLYCRTGVRAGRALSVLLAKGYDAYSIRGGIAAWWREIIEPPSVTMVPFGKTGDLFRKRQGLRNHFVGLPGAGGAFPAPPGPPIPRKKRLPQAAAPPPAPPARALPPRPTPVAPDGGRPVLQNPCG